MNEPAPRDGWPSSLRSASGSAHIALLLLVAANVLPLIGVTLFAWDVTTILVLYWVENGIVGVTAVARILLARSPDSWNPPGAGRGTLPARALQAGFFVVHYGIFWMVHGFFVLLLTGSLPTEGCLVAECTAPMELVIYGHPAIVIGALALLIGQTGGLVFDYIGKREYLTATPLGQMFRPYPRLIALHLTVVIGAAYVIGQGSPVLLVALLVVFKTIGELVLYAVDRRSHRARDSRGLVAG